MENRYLFRGKRINNGEWVKGFIGIHTFIPLEESGKETYLGTVIEKVPERIYDCESYEVDESTICQCTGLKDKNGKLIFENDIVTVPRDEDPYVITWDKDCGKWSINQYAAYVYDFDNFWSMELEVIGNIFNNPKLLEVRE